MPPTLAHARTEATLFSDDLSAPVRDPAAKTLRKVDGEKYGSPQLPLRRRVAIEAASEYDTLLVLLEKVLSDPQLPVTVPRPPYDPHEMFSLVRRHKKIGRELQAEFTADVCELLQTPRPDTSEIQDCLHYLLHSVPLKDWRNCGRWLRDPPNESQLRRINTLGLHRFCGKARSTFRRLMGYKLTPNLVCWHMVHSLQNLRGGLIPESIRTILCILLKDYTADPKKCRDIRLVRELLRVCDHSNHILRQTQFLCTRITQKDHTTHPLSLAAAVPVHDANYRPRTTIERRACILAAMQR
ncbi:hypothetical protein DFJ73DRAFT_802097, partial [Zopfochytrium polystomum]